MLVLFTEKLHLFNIQFQLWRAQIWWEKKVRQHPGTQCDLTSSWTAMSSNYLKSRPKVRKGLHGRMITWTYCQWVRGTESSISNSLWNNNTYRSLHTEQEALAVTSKDTSTQKTTETSDLHVQILDLVLTYPHGTANDHWFLSWLKFSVSQTSLCNLRILEQRVVMYPLIRAKEQASTLEHPDRYYLYCLNLMLSQVRELKRIS